MSKLLIGIDQSTSATKVVVMNEAGELIHKLKKEHKQYYPQPGWVEHDLDEIYTNTTALLEETFSIYHEAKWHCLSITNQRETIAFWDRETGRPLCKALVWQCRRGASICEDLRKEGYKELVYKKTGLQLDTYFSASKIKWALTHIEAVKQAAKDGSLCIGTIDSYLIYRLTDEKTFATDVTNASRTLLYNIHTSNWDEDLLDLFGVEPTMLPVIMDNNAIFGTLISRLSDQKIKVAGVIGDSQGALFGQQCYKEGLAKVTYGTGSSILIYGGTDSEIASKHLLTSLAWSLNKTRHFALEGIINSSGDALKWVQDNLGLFESQEELNTMMKEVPSTEGVYLIPAFTGLGAPYWEQEARAAILGMTRKTDKNHIIRAALESIAYQVADIFNIVQQEEKIKLSTCYIDGGASSNSDLMQFQADLLQFKLSRRKQEELSVIGALYMGGLAVGLWKDLESLAALSETDKTYQPKMQAEEALQKINDWRKMVKILF